MMDMDYFVCFLLVVLNFLIALANIVISPLIKVSKLLFGIRSNYGESLQKLLKCRNNSKLPKHLAISCPNQFLKLRDIEFTIGKLAEVVSWAYVADIKRISIHDIRGILQLNRASFEKLLEKAICDAWVALENSGKFERVSKQMPFICLDNNTFQTSHAKENCICVNMFPSGPSIIDGIKKLLNKRGEFLIEKDGKLNNLEIQTINQSVNQTIINDKISNGELIFCDPDLLMIFGGVKSTLGFMPWNLKLTEMHWLPQLRNAKIDDFVDSLNKYDNCQQRFGK